MSLQAACLETAVRKFVPYTVVSNVLPVPQTLRDHLSVLREQGRTQRLARNETIFQEGDRARTVCRIVSGSVRLCRHTQDGRRHIAEFAIAGDLIGVLDGDTQAFTAEAVTEVTLIAYPRADFDRQSERDPRFRANVLSHLAATLMSAQLHTFTLGCQSAKERLASFLVRFAERTGATATGRLELPMGRQDIADHLGLTIETICRAITVLKTEQLLAVPNTHQLVVRDLARLRALSGGGTAH